MTFRLIHRWLGLFAGALALVLGLTGAMLALDPVTDAWQARAGAGEPSVAALAQRIGADVPGTEEIRRLPSGMIVAYSYDQGEVRANRIDPVDGRVRGPWQPSLMPRWVKNLHRSLLLGDVGRAAAAVVALSMLVLSITGLVLLLRRLGGWRRLGGQMRGRGTDRLHAVTGRLAIPVLLVSALAALWLSATTFNLVSLDPPDDPDPISTSALADDLPVAQLPLLQTLPLGELKRLGFPNPDDPEDTWQVTTTGGQGWLDRRSGELLVWQDATLAQRIHGWAMLLHTGEGAWVWAVLLGLAGASIPLFWFTGLILWWRARRARPRIVGNQPLPQADTLVFVASETGTTWGFAAALHAALGQAGHRVHVAPLEHFQAAAGTRRIIVLAATYGDGQSPAHATGALEKIARTVPQDAAVAVLGFGDRQYPAFCAFADALEQSFRAQGWPTLLPLARIHQQSAQEFARWCETLAEALGEPLQVHYRPHLPPTCELRLISRESYPGQDDRPGAILRFALPARGWRDRLAMRGLGGFVAGDLLGVLAPGSSVPRYYSLASGHRDGFVELCVRLLPGGECSTFLHGLAPGDAARAFVRPNPGFTLERDRRPAVLIGAGTGVAPLAGFIRGNRRHVPMHLYFGARDPARDFYFGENLTQWLADGRLTRLRTIFSRVGDGGYVQDALRQDAQSVREAVRAGARIRVCGSRPMAHDVVLALDEILAPLDLDIARLRAAGRYAEDVF